MYLSADDVHRLAGESGDHGALVLLLAFCGLRWGEAIALRVRDVEFLRRRLMVSENAVQLGVNHAVGPTKGRTARSVPVPTFVLDELSQHCQDKASNTGVPWPQTVGSRRQSGTRRFSRLHLTTFDIRARVSRSVPGSTFCPYNGCSDTSQ
jgi:integrase